MHAGVTMGRRAQERLVTILIRVSRGRQRSFGFPEPDFGLLRARLRLSLHIFCLDHH